MQQHDLVSSLRRGEILCKLSGYRQQDKHNGFFDPARFVSFDLCARLLSDSHECCYYCMQPTKVIYEQVRDPQQWTLERLDNSRGHDEDNVVISCLRCNLRRRLMLPQRYLLTKRLVRVVKLAAAPCEEEGEERKEGEEEKGEEEMLKKEEMGADE